MEWPPKDNLQQTYGPPNPELIETVERRRRYKGHAPNLTDAVGSLSAGEFEEAIAVALLDIAKNLDKIASQLSELIEIQRRNTHP